ncbi:MAG: hypothetical protein DMF69_09820 [Acidobacteria bacterium]|nr:MAG: hypothetical protein DMF69_09820 [Acidobacteriota bacterium]
MLEYDNLKDPGRSFEDWTMEKLRLQRIERYILNLFRVRGTTNVLAKQIFDSTDEFSNADLVRAFEDLEKNWRLLVRHTTEGNDWISLTPEGAEAAEVKPMHYVEQSTALPHPPKSATQKTG